MVAISAATADAMGVYDNFPRNRIQVIHNGIDFSQLNPIYDKVEKRRELGLPEGCTVVGTASRLNEIKNIPMMLRVFKQVNEQLENVYLVIAGDGPERKALEQMVDDFGIAEKVKFIGMRFDLPEIYPLFDVFLLTSFTEGISVTLLEALGSAVPVVVTDVGGNKEILSGANSSFLIELEDEAGFVDLIIRIIENKYGIKSSINSLSENIKNKFSEYNMMKSYMRLYLKNRNI